MLRICWLPAALFAAAVCATAGGPGVRAQFIGGTLTTVAPKSTALLDLADVETLGVVCGNTSLRIPYRKINTLEYGQHVSRRYAAAVIISPILLLSKSRRHFITLGYVDADGAQQAVVLRIENGDIRSVLSALEARSGRRLEYQDDEARKGAK